MTNDGSWGHPTDPPADEPRPGTAGWGRYGGGTGQPSWQQGQEHPHWQQAPGQPQGQQAPGQPQWQQAPGQPSWQQGHGWDQAQGRYGQGSPIPSYAPPPQDNVSGGPAAGYGAPMAGGYGASYGVPMRHPRAATVQWLGILAIPFSLGCLGVILAVIALAMSGGVTREIMASNGRYTGLQQVRTGRICAVVALAIFAVLVVIGLVTAALDS